MLRFTHLVRSLFTPALAPHEESEQALAAILHIPPKQLPAVRLGGRYHYRPFAIAKRDGRERRILAPSPALKELQRRLLHDYLGDLPVHPAATAFIPGSSIVANAQRHAGQAIIVTVDLQDFFESTRGGRVRAFFIRQGWRGEALAALMRLCVYHNGLPQGAPTSPALSNLVNIELDEALNQLARRAGATYTRYGDDLTFSWRTDNVPANLQAAVCAELLRAGYQVQPRKNWHVYQASEEPQITGLVIGRDGQIRAPRRILDQVNKLRWRAWWTHDEDTLARLRGYEGFLNTPGLK